MYQKSSKCRTDEAHPSPDKDVKLRFVVSRERLGFIFAIKGEWQKALDNDLDMLAHTESLCALEPSSLDYARDKATALDHVGDSFSRT